MKGAINFWDPEAGGNIITQDGTLYRLSITAAAQANIKKKLDDLGNDAIGLRVTFANQGKTNFATMVAIDDNQDLANG